MKPSVDLAVLRFPTRLLRCSRPWFALALTTFATSALAAHWPAWRGPTGDGVSVEHDLPLRWSATENVRWRVALPERGNSTPVIWGNKVFVTQAREKENRRTLMCFDRATGKLLWQSGVTYTDKEMTHGTNPQCSASPVTDGERVIVSFASAGLYCYDFQGQELWHRDLGRQEHIWGNASSPVLHEQWCFLNFGPGERSFLLAVDKKTGKTVWQKDEPGGVSGEKAPDGKQNWIGSWSTPLIIQENKQDTLIMSWPLRVAALDPRTGQERWTCQGLNPLVYTSPLHRDGVVVAMGGYGGKTLAVKSGGQGDVTATRRLWHHPQTQQRIGSGVIHEGHVYILNDPGVAECFELSTGKLIWKERLVGPGKNNDSWSSLVLAGGRIYAVNKSADTFVLKASPQFEVLATNSLGEETMSSIAPSEGELFIRTYRSLWCLGGKK